MTGQPTPPAPPLGWQPSHDPRTSIASSPHPPVQVALSQPPQAGPPTFPGSGATSFPAPAQMHNPGSATGGVIPVPTATQSHHLRPLRRRLCPIPVREFKSRPHTIRERPTLARFGLRRTGEAHSGLRSLSGLQLRPSTQRPPARCLEETPRGRTRLHLRRRIRFTRTPLRRGRLLNSTGASRLRSTVGSRLLTRVSIIGRLNLPSLALRHRRHMLPRLCLPT
jgi:hypothetical protein